MVTLKWAQPGAGWGTGTLLALDTRLCPVTAWGRWGPVAKSPSPHAPLLPTGVAATLLASLGLSSESQLPLVSSWALKSPLLLSLPPCPFPPVPSQPWAAALWCPSPQPS